MLDEMIEQNFWNAATLFFLLNEQPGLHKYLYYTTRVIGYLLGKKISNMN